MSRPGEERWLRSSNPSTESPEREEKLDCFMERWVELDEARAEREEARTEREEARRAADREQAAEQQDRWIQALTDARRPTVIPPVTALPPRLTLQKFVEGVDDMGAYLDTFEVIARAGEWPREQWSVYLRSSLSGQGLSAVASLPAADQADYSMVKQTLLSTYHISTDHTERRHSINPSIQTTQTLGFVYTSSRSHSGLIQLGKLHLMPFCTN